MGGSEFRDVSAGCSFLMLRLVLIVFISLLAPAEIFASDVESGAKLPVPDNVAQKAAMRLLDDAYGKRRSAARKSAEKAAMAKELLDAGRGDSDTANRFVTVSTARDMATAAGDLTTSVQAIDELDRSFQIDTLQMKMSAATGAGRALTNPEDRDQFVNQSLALLDQATAADRYELVPELGNLVISEARQSKDPWLIEQGVDRSRRAIGAAESFGEVNKAIAILRREPQDTNANLTVGRFRCFVRGDWDGGLPRLALGSDPHLKELALSDLSRPATANNQVLLADKWWELADNEKKEFKSQILSRAAKWYSAALPEMTGLKQLRAQKRLQEAEAAARAAESPGGRELLATMRGQGLVENGVIVLSGDQLDQSAEPFRPPVAFTIVAQTDSTNLRIRYAADQIIFNWERNPDELRIDGGPADHRYLAGAGGVPVNEWVRIDLIVLPDSMTIVVDGKERYRTNADFSKVNMPIGIFSAGSTVKVKSIYARRP